MKILHLIGGGDVGGAKMHVLSLVKALSELVNVKVISYREGVFSTEGLEMGIDIEIVKTGTIFGDIKRTIDIAKNGNYEIIHSHGAKANMISSIVSRFTNLPTVTTVHSDYKLDYLGNILKHISFGFINRTALRAIQYHIGVSDSFKEMLISRGFNKDRTFTVYNGIDFNENISVMSKQDFLHKYEMQDNNNLLIGILARLYPVKSIETLLSAAEILLQEFGNIQFLVAGDGPEMKHLQEIAKSLKIQHKVHFLGHIDDPDSFMHTIDINILTSISESFPYAILEGARAKKPTISTCVGGIADIIKHGENGFLFEVRNHEQLAHYIKELITNQNLREQFGNNIYTSAKSQFSLENMRNTQLNIYKAILNLSNNTHSHTI